MKVTRIFAAAFAAFVLATVAQAQIKAGASSLGIFGNLNKSQGTDLNGSAFGNYSYFVSDNVSLSLLGGVMWVPKADTSVFGGADLSYYFSRDKVAPYVGVGASGQTGNSNVQVRGFVGCEWFVSEKSSFDLKGVYERSTGSGSGYNLRAEFGFKIYLN
jgi:hypothetical protein